jgi:hypothetical protein
MWSVGLGLTMAALEHSLASDIFLDFYVIFIWFEIGWPDSTPEYKIVDFSVKIWKK